MSKTAILFLSCFGFLSVWAFFFAPAGVWLYVFEWYHHPPYHWWGKGLSLLGRRWSLLAGIVMIASLILHLGKFRESHFISHLQTNLLILFTINAFLVTAISDYRDQSLTVAYEHLKMFVLYWCVVKTHSDSRNIFVLLLICVFSCIEWGFDLTLDPPSGRALGISAPSISDENFVAAHVVAFIPLAGLMFLGIKKKWRWLLLAGIPFMVNVVAFSRSRGAFLALLFTGVFSLWLSKGKLKKIVIVACVLGAIVSLRLFNDEFMERQTTIVSYSEDGSSMGRIYAWQAAWKLTLQKPFGYGGEAFDLGIGASLMEHGFHTTHNMFFECLVAWGFQGVFFLYAFILLSCFDCWRIYKYYTINHQEWPPHNISLMALGILLGLLSMLVSSVFLNRIRWELWWIFAGLTVGLKNVTVRDNNREKN